MDAIEYEAMKRAQDMQSRAKAQAGRNPHSTSDANKRETTEPNAEREKKAEALPSHPPMSSPLDTLFEDKEKLLILLLILILASEENCDPTLILALLYVII